MTGKQSIPDTWSPVGADGHRSPHRTLKREADKKIPALQGLRGIAVVLVVLFHALTRYVPFGWVGVWLFFSLSGFVITLSLRKASLDKDGTTVMLNFYKKRAFRILPLYILILAVGCFICLMMAMSGRPNVPPALEHLPFLVSVTYNFYRMSSVYQHTELFGHLWSLCVEEQFYLVYPFIFLLLRPVAYIRFMVFVILACPIGRLCLNLYLSEAGYSENQIATIIYLCPLSNFDAFAAGCLGACLQHRTAQFGQRFWFSLTAALVFALGSYLAIRTLMLGNTVADVAKSLFSAEVRGLSDQVFIYSFLALAAGGLVAVCASKTQSALAILTVAPLVWIGEISYGIYMYHFPLLYLRFEFLPKSIKGPYAAFYGLSVFLIYFISLILISYLSLRHLERPFLRLSDQIRRQKESALPTLNLDPRG